VSAVDDQSFLSETRQRFAKRGLTDFQFFGEIDEVDPVAGFELVANQKAPELVIDPLAQTQMPEFTKNFYSLDFLHSIYWQLYSRRSSHPSSDSALLCISNNRPARAWIQTDPSGDPLAGAFLRQ
jgi:hypothetical protein